VATHFQVFLGDAAEPAPKTFYDRLTLLEVDENAELPGAIQLTLPVTTRGNSATEDLTQVEDAHFRPFSHIAVVVKIDGRRDECIFDGYVLSHKIHLEAGTTASSLRVWGQDASVLMDRVDRVKEWQGTDVEAANSIFRNGYSFRPSEQNSDPDAPQHPESGHTLMQRSTDAQFLRERARRTGKLFRVCCEDRAGDNVGYFIKPNLKGNPVLTLVLNPQKQATVDALDFEWDVMRPTSVLARQALFSDKEEDGADGGAQESGLDALDRTPLAQFVGKQEYNAVTRLTVCVDDAGELKQRSASLLTESNWFVRCIGEGELSRLGAVLRVGRLVSIAGAGNLHSGKYFVWSVHHTFTATTHRMRFVLVRNAVGPTDWQTG
jgi:hypothetical protein